MPSDHSGVNVDRALIPGTLYGYRWWKILSDERLYAVNSGELWSPETVARCTKSDIVWSNSKPGLHEKVYPPAHAAPQADCTCGIYARYLPTDLEGITSGSIARHPIIYVKGVIAVSGNIELGTRGFRAEKARILALCPPTFYDYRQYQNRVYEFTLYIAKVIAERYQVGYFDHFNQLARKYPPSNLEELLFGDKQSYERDKYVQALTQAQYMLEDEYQQFQDNYNPYNPWIAQSHQENLERQLRLRELALRPILSPEETNKLIKNIGM